MKGTKQPDIDKFFDALHEADDPVSRLEICHKAADVVNTYYTTINSRHTRFTDLRKVIDYIDNPEVDVKEREFLKTVLKLSDKEVKQRAQASAGKVKGKNSMLELIDPVQCIGKANELLKSARTLDVAIALLLFTGRRSVEIMKTARFERVSDTHVLFYGQVKRKAPKQNDDDYQEKLEALTAPLLIPVLGDVEEIITALGKVRQHYNLEAIDNDGVENKFSSRLRELTIEHFPFIPNVSPHRLRAAYACIAASIYKSDEVAPHVFYSEVLGHAETSTASFANYFVFRLPKEV